MPSNGNKFLRSQYPDYGWSSWFGGPFDQPYPAACPYGMVLKAPGSTGIFRPFNTGVKYICEVENLLEDRLWIASFKPPVAIANSSIAMKTGPAGQTDMFITYYVEGGAPLFLYGQFVVGLWAQMRKPYLFLGPGPAPLPMLDAIGPSVTLTPYNKRGFGMLT